MEKYDLEKLKTTVARYREARARRDIAETERSWLKTELKHLSSWLHKRNYALYLESSEWKAKQRAVLKRDDYRCTICSAPAEHIHHLTYDRIFDEPLYDLVSVCIACHEIIHTLDKKAQNK